MPAALPEGRKRTRSRWGWSALLALGLALVAAGPGRAAPVAHGQIAARARVLAPVGRSEAAAYLARWDREQIVQRAAGAVVAREDPAFGAVDFDHDRLRIRLLPEEGEPCLQIESLAN